MARLRRCPDCGSTVLSGAAPSYICMDCDCEFRVTRKGVDPIASFGGKVLSDTPLF